MKHLLLALAFFFVNTNNTASAAEPKYIHVHPGGDQVDIDCPPEGGTVTAYDEVGNVLSTYECAPAANNASSPSIFDWSVGAEGFYLDANGGPHGGGLDAFFEGRLRIDDDLKFVFDIGPGVAFLISHGTAPTLSELVGLDYQISKRFEIVFGARHRVVFDGSGDLTNALIGEVQLRIVTNSLSLRFGGGIGGAWFPETGPQPGLWPGGVTPPTITLLGDGLVWGLNFGLAF
jgi:hypothetical protein